jgi:REP element-mobilizing transposase RayT
LRDGQTNEDWVYRCALSCDFARRPPRVDLRSEDHRAYLKILAEVVERFGWCCYAYCLMDNHYHLVIETLAGNLSAGMRQLNGVSPRYRIAATAGLAICFKLATKPS